MDNGSLSTILLDKQHATVGETVMLFWHGSFTTSSTDWIGLFYSGDVHSVSNCLDYRQSGDGTGKKGMKWLISSNINFQQAENKCWFKYVHGASGSVKATSQTLNIINTDLQGSISPSGTLTTWSLFAGHLLQFSITEMEATSLKRTLFGRPSPYVKVNLRPGRMQRKAWRLHHGLIGKTSCQHHTTEPSWREEVLEFQASIWDILEVEVRNRSTTIKPSFSRFLGKLQFPLRELLTMGRSRTQTFTRHLMKREHSHKILGTFSLTIKTNRDLPGSRRSRRLPTPENYAVERGLETNEDNRRQSLNASTPDDDLSDRTGTESVPCAGRVFRATDPDVQSQPDLLGLPYERHEPVRIRKDNGYTNRLSCSEYSNALSSRLSMPAFLLSNSSLRSFDNYPSTSESFPNSMQLDHEDSVTCQEPTHCEETTDAEVVGSSSFTTLDNTSNRILETTFAVSGGDSVNIDISNPDIINIEQASDRDEMGGRQSGVDDFTEHASEVISEEHDSTNVNPDVLVDEDDENGEDASDVTTPECYAQEVQSQGEFVPQDESTAEEATTSSSPAVSESSELSSQSSPSAELPSTSFQLYPVTSQEEATSSSDLTSQDSPSLARSSFLHEQVTSSTPLQPTSSRVSFSAQFSVDEATSSVIQELPTVNDEAPVSEPNAQSTAAQSTAAQSTAAQSTAAQSTAAQPTAAQSTSAQSTAAQSTAPQSTSAQSTAAQSTSAQSTAAQPTAAQSTSAQSTSAQPTAPQSTSAQSTAAQSTSVQSTSAQSTAAQSTAAQSTSVQSTAAQSTSAQSTAAQSTSALSSAAQSTAALSSVAQSTAVQSTAAQSGSRDEACSMTLGSRLQNEESDDILNFVVTPSDTEMLCSTSSAVERDERIDGEHSRQSSGSSFSAFEERASAGQSFMDAELEPDVMNSLSISDPSNCDLRLSSHCDEASSRPTFGNLRTLFQVPENLARACEEACVLDSSTVSTNDVTSSTLADCEENESSRTQGDDEVALSSRSRVLSVFSTRMDTSEDSSTVSTNDVTSSTLADCEENVSSRTQGDEEVALSSRNRVLSVFSTRMDTSEDSMSTEQDTTSNNDRNNCQNGAAGFSVADETSSDTSPNSNHVMRGDGAVNNEAVRTLSRVPSITHVRHLRSKHLSIRLPSSPLPVVHVVPPHVPVSQQNISGLGGSPSESEPVLPATQLQGTLESSNRSLNEESSPSYSDATELPATDAAGPSTSSDTSHPSTSHQSGSHPTTCSKRRNNEVSHDGNAKRKTKTRHQEVMATGNMNTPQVQARRTNGTNRDVAQHTSSNDDQASHRPASIYVQISDFPSDEEVLDEPLPPQWERAVDTYGRVYYIDHENRITTWIRPSAASVSETSLNEVNHHRQNLDRRYQSFRRTLSGRRRRGSRDHTADTTTNSGNSSNSDNSSNSGNVTDNANNVTEDTTDGQSSSSAVEPSSPPAERSVEPTPSRQVGDNRLLLTSNFVKFLTRADLITFLRNSGTPGQFYFSHSEVKDMVKRIRHDPRNYQRFMHDRSLVTFLNGFTDTSRALPRGWEQKTDQYGQTYFVDHNSRSTNFADPRLPVDVNVSRNRSRATLETAYADRSRRPPPPGMQRTTNSSNNRASRRNAPGGMSYNQQIVDFLRQPNIDNVLSAKNSSYASNVALRCSVEKIRRDGQRALRLLSDNVDLIVLLSLFEDDIVSYVPDVKPKQLATTKKRNYNSTNDDTAGPSSRKTSKPTPYKRDFQAKVKSFHKNILHNGLGQGPNKIPVIIRRDHILEDAFDHIMKENPKNLHKSKLEIKFSGEEGLDYGGPQREFFFLLSRQLFNPYYGLFEYSAQDTYTLHISPMSSFVDNAHEWYRFSGRIIALVIIHQHLLDAFFTRPFYKLLLKSSCDLRDVEALDALFHRSLAWIMETDITDEALDLTFTVNEELGGQVTERELVAGGRDIRVSEDNKLGYVELMSNWRIDRGVSDQRKSILRGFYEIMDYDLISTFDACELELLISGTADIDVNDWFTNTEYRSGYHANHRVVRWFWQAVHSFDNEQRLRLLQFVTGTSSVPYEGFAALRGSTGTRKFCIEKWANHKMLPRAHTCFNRLDLPPYNTYNELLEKLTLAVEETSTFGIQ